DGLAEVANPHRRAVAVGNDDGIEGFGVENLIGGVERQRLLGTIERTLWRIDGRGPDCATDIFEADAHRRRDRRVDLDTNGRLLLTMVVDQSDTGDAGNPRRNVALDIFVNLRDWQVVGGDGNFHQQGVPAVHLLLVLRIGP